MRRRRRAQAARFCAPRPPFDGAGSCACAHRPITSLMGPSPRPGGSSPSPDAIRQLEALDRDLLTWRDVERLFGVSRARAAQLMRTFGAELVGASRVLRRTALLRQLRKYRQRAEFRGEEERRTRLVAELRQARITGILVAVPRLIVALLHGAARQAGQGGLRSRS